MFFFYRRARRMLRPRGRARHRAHTYAGPRPRKLSECRRGPLYLMGLFFLWVMATIAAGILIAPARGSVAAIWLVWLIVIGAAGCFISMGVAFSPRRIPRPTPPPPPPPRPRSQAYYSNRR